MKIKIYCYLLFTLLYFFFELQADPVSIQIETQSEYEILEKFFRMGVLDESYSYVLAGEKPISIRTFLSLAGFPTAKDRDCSEKEFIRTLLLRDVLPVWKKCCAAQKNFVLKVIPGHTSGLIELGSEVQFINTAKLQQVIEENIHLFRYILGPAVDAKQLTHRIAYSEEPLSDILLNNLTLEGIVLGFGTHNSIAGGRAETIGILMTSQDTAPFTNKGCFSQENQQYYGSFYLDLSGGSKDFPYLKEDLSTFKPSHPCCNMKAELAALDAMNEPLPSCLFEKPAFIFAAYKGGESNQPLFERLEGHQKEAKTLLNDVDFLEKILTKIGGEKPYINCEKPRSSSLSLASFQGRIDVQLWKRILQEAVHRFENIEQQEAFVQALTDSFPSLVIPKMIGVSKFTLEGLNKALNRLSVTNEYFEKLSKEASLQEIVPKQLYFKITHEGSGKELKNTDRVQVSYTITDTQQSILIANHATWLNLSETIPGFVHGLQGMRVGEKREVFIHPSLAYGITTTLPPCIELIVKVHLLDIDEKSSKPLPDLVPIDLSWIQNPLAYQAVEESVRQLPSFKGAFYSQILDKIEGVNKSAIIAELLRSINPTQSQTLSEK